MVKKVQLPDGTTAEFPDDMSNEQIAQVLRQQFPAEGQDRSRRAIEGQGQEVTPPTGLDPLAGIQEPVPAPGQPPVQQIDPTDPLPPEPEGEQPGLISGLREQPGDIDPGVTSMLASGAIPEGDFRQQKIKLAGVSGRDFALREGGNILEQFAKSQTGAGLRSLQPFTLADFFSAAGQALSTDMSPDEALEFQREFRKVLEEKFPATTISASIVGDIAGGGATLKALKLASKGTSAGRLLESLTTFGTGIKGNIINAFKGAAIGAPVVATIAAIRGEDPVTGAAFGAAGGPIGVAFAKSVGITVNALKFGLGQVSRLVPGDFRKFFDDPAAKGLKALAKMIKRPEKEVLDDALKFKNATGRTPSMAELDDPDLMSALNATISASTAATKIARETAEDILQKRPGEVAEQVTGGRVTVSQAGEKAKRTKIAEEQFALAEQDDIVFDVGEVSDLLDDRVFLEGIGPRAKFRLQEVLSGRGDVAITLPGILVNDMRKALRARAKGAKGSDLVFGELADELEDVARAQSEAFGIAIDTFRKRSTRIEGLAAGEQVFKPGTTKAVEQATREAAGEPSRAAGRRVGARGAVEEEVGETAGKTLSALKNITDNVGLGRRLRALLPGREVDKLQEVAAVQSKAIEGIAGAVPGVKINKDVQEAVNGVVSAAILVSTGTSLASKVIAFGRLLQNLLRGVDERVVKNLSRDAFDPEKLPEVLTVLRRMNVGEDEILDIFASVLVGAERAGRQAEDSPPQ